MPGEPPDDAGLSMTRPFELRSDFSPKGDQPAAISTLTRSLDAGDRYQTLLGITGSGKTFTVANVIQHVQRPTLIMAPNKTLAAQLYAEMRDLFPNNAVHYFVSYYDYYQPEAYIPTTDTFIDKDAIINDQIDRMRHAATHALLSRPDVIIIASVSCIYGIGSAESYAGLLIEIVKGEELLRDNLLRRLVDIQYERNDVDFHRGTFRVRGDVVEIFPAYEDKVAIRVEFFGDEVDDHLRGRPGCAARSCASWTVRNVSRLALRHAATATGQRPSMRSTQELRERLEYYDKQEAFSRSSALSSGPCTTWRCSSKWASCRASRTTRGTSRRKPGEPPPTLIDYFPDDFLLILDESHQTVPQIGAMYRGDRSRKETLVEYGFRCRAPSTIAHSSSTSSRSTCGG